MERVLFVIVLILGCRNYRLWVRVSSVANLTKVGAAVAQSVERAWGTEVGRFKSSYWTRLGSWVSVQVPLSKVPNPPYAPLSQQPTAPSWQGVGVYLCVFMQLEMQRTNFGCVCMLHVKYLINNFPPGINKSLTTELQG